jgi:hypothetical protein
MRRHSPLGILTYTQVSYGSSRAPFLVLHPLAMLLQRFTDIFLVVDKVPFGLSL